MWAKIKSFLFSLKGKAILLATLFIAVFMAIIGYNTFTREKNLYFKNMKNQASALVETAGINFSNALISQEVGLTEETGLIDHYIADMLTKEKSILTILIFDESGKIIAHSQLSEYGKIYKDAGNVLNYKDTVIREINDIARGPILEAVTPLMIGRKKIATLRMEFSLKGFYGELAGLVKSIVLLTILAIVVSSFVTVVGINAILAPVERLSKAMDDVDYGIYDGFSEKPRRDEIGQLQKSFISMVNRLREADLQWENTFDSITDLISIHTSDYTIVKANRALAQRLHTTADRLIGKKCWEVFHGFDGACPGCPHSATLTTMTAATLEVEYPALGGIFLTTTFPVFNEKGELTGTIHIAKDITEEKRLQEKFIQSEKMASMGQMAAGIAHEINNPLNSILGYATYLLETSDGLSGKEELDRIARAAARCRDAVRRFLDFARETPSKRELVNVKDIAENILSMLHHQISSQKIEVVCEIGAYLWINADKGQIEEVFINMVLNACDAMPDGGRLSITAAGDDSWIKVNISDTGCGIPKENLNKIFDPFFTTKDPGKGTGLGLAVSHTIIRNHGGSIDCRSEPGAGTNFTITLPGIV